MKWRGVNELREMYLSFFERKNHTRMASASLVPQGDNSLLLINSGMAPLKKFFLGQAVPPNKRVTTCQKCIRTPDIERVGKTARHGTYFEMLGNFSFGDYFKTEAIEWAWEFLTKDLEIPADRLWITVFESDDEAEQIWMNKIGVPKERIIRLGKEDNFWEHGSGPCGPCSEIHFDRGEEYGPLESFEQASDCDRIIEIWNLVFSQFDSDGKGNYPPMEHPNIDTGMGLERLACIMQGVDNLFLVDTVQNIMKKICEIAGVSYGEDKKKDISLRVITDHVRSCTFMIGDGVMPSNEGRGYVLRRLLRRASRHGRLLGVNRCFLSEVAEVVIAMNEDSYPELREKQDMILKLIRIEEENFARTIDSGLQMLNDLIEKEEGRTLSGESAFKLNDTYGFPLDLTREILAEHGMDVDEEKFRSLMLQQRERARNARKNAGKDAWEGEGSVIEDLPETEFLGYEQMACEAQILAIVRDGERVESAQQGEEVTLIFDKTTLYAESGGQVGDHGTLEMGDAAADICDTQKNHAKVFMHMATVTAGTLNVGNKVKLMVDVVRRNFTMRNHTAAHLLQAALRKVLGTHVEQAGQLVTPDHVRFDFTHFSALTREELSKVEGLVNHEILAAVPVTMKEMPIEEARKLGAMALFGEKYGDVVRVVSVEDGFSREFCGGTHMDNTARLGLFKITGETSVAAGVRRIEGVTGAGVLQMLGKAMNTIEQTASVLKVNNSHELVARAGQLVVEEKEKDRRIEELEGKLASMRVDGLFEGAKRIGGALVISAMFSGTDSGALRTLGDRVREKAPNVLAVFIGTKDGKASIAVAAGKEAVKNGLHAGKIAKAVAQIAGGNGGGKPDFAMAGARDMTKLDEALAAVEEIVAGMVKE